MRRSAVFPAAIASSATTVMLPVLRTRSSSSGRAADIEYDYAKCTGCAVCFEQCPCHAIEMVAEQQGSGRNG